MKREVTRTTRALIASIVAMVLCCAMLIGTTYAWFTDVSSASVSDIHSGNLRAELYKVIGNAEIKVNEETNLFDENVLWELGHTEVAYLKVSNEGNLDLKYRLTINVTNKTIGKTHDGADIDLSQYLRFAVIETASQFSSGDAARNAAESVSRLISAGFVSEESKLPANTKSDLIAIVVYMPEEAGNTANHNGTNIPSIDLNLSIATTQDAGEFENIEDSDTLYTVTSNEEFAEAIADATAGDTITLSSGTFILPATAIPAGVVISGNGAANTAIVTNADGYTIENDNVTIQNLTVDGRAASGVHYSGAINLRGNNAILDNCVINGGGTTTWGASVYINLNSGETAHIRNSIISGGFRGIFLGSQAGSVVVDSCDIDAVYPINVDGDGDFSLTVINSKLHGWTSYARITSATFIDTEFSMGASGYDVVAAYTDTTFKNCTFDSAFKIYAQISGFGFVFENCMKDGVAVTAENFKTLFPEDPDVWTRCTCTVNGVTVTP